MIKIYSEIENHNIQAKMLLQVHDELVFEIDNKDIKNTIPKIKDIMENTHKIYKDFKVPLTVDFGYGNNWGESH